MKHIWIVESSGGRKWNAAFHGLFLKKSAAKAQMDALAHYSPGLKWRVAKYVREAK